jgi:hypothetical protein
MAEPEEKAEIATEKLFRYCIGERQAINVVRVELHGIARFACWWFVILSMAGMAVGLLSQIH